MNSNDIFNALGKIDDDLIYKSQYNKKKKAFSKIKKFGVAAAAAVIIIAGLAVGIPKLDNKGKISVKSDFGITVNAESIGKNFTVNKNNQIIIPNTTIEKILKNTDYNIEANTKQVDSVIKVSLNDENTYSQELFFKNNDKTEKFDAKLNNDKVNIENSDFDITFKDNKKIKILTVSTKSGDIFPFYEDDVYKNKNDEIVIKWTPTNQIKKFLKDTSNSNYDFSKLTGDTLDISVVYTDNSKENYKVIYSWNKNGSLIIEMK